MTETGIILVMALITFAFRFLPLLLFNQSSTMPKWVERWFVILPPVILTAVTIQAIATATSTETTKLPYLAYLACLGTAIKTKRLFLSLGVGLFTLVILNVFA